MMFEKKKKRSIHILLKNYKSQLMTNPFTTLFHLLNLELFELLFFGVLPRYVFNLFLILNLFQLSGNTPKECLFHNIYSYQLFFFFLYLLQLPFKQ